MKYIEYQEHRQHGTSEFPIACYRENPYSPRYVMQLHWHRHCEILHIRSGAFEISLDGRRLPLHEGDVCFINDGVIHGGVPQECVYECIVFDTRMLTLAFGSAVSRTLREFSDHTIVPRPLLGGRTSQVSAIVDDLIFHISGRQPGYELAVQGCLYALFGQILADGAYIRGSEIRPQDDRLHPIKNTLAYIAAHYSENVTLSQLAEVAGMNPNYFCRFFREFTGRTPVDYLNYYRVECACELLVTQNITAAAAASACGFQDAAYFTRCFRKYKDMTPRQYAKREFV